jgi:histidyl-tRNA synthetase
MWRYIEQKIRGITKLYNFKEVRTPTFEYTELFLRGVGESTDIVNKEMYTFSDKGGRSLTLKPEGTAGAVRAYIENGVGNEASPNKLYYITPVFRYENTQTGRLREHHQFGAEFFGSGAPEADYEVIALADGFFKSLGIADLQLYINSIGCKTCREKYLKRLIDFYNKQKAALCPTCNDRLIKNPLRLLDCKTESCIAVNKSAPDITQFLCAECGEHLTALQELLKSGGLKFKINPKIVRGLDYYNRTVFEFVSGGIGAQSTVCGGGRYDGLVEKLGGKPTAAVGFGLGLERLLLLLKSGARDDAITPAQDGVDVFVAPMDDAARAEAAALIKKLRGCGISCDTDFLDKSIKAQLKYADRLNARFTLIIGERELSDKTVAVKDMRAQSQETVRSVDLEKYLTEKLKG